MTKNDFMSDAGVIEGKSSLFNFISQKINYCNPYLIKIKLFRLNLKYSKSDTDTRYFR